MVPTVNNFELFAFTWNYFVLLHSEFNKWLKVWIRRKQYFFPKFDCLCELAMSLFKTFFSHDYCIILFNRNTNIEGPLPLFRAKKCLWNVTFAFHLFPIEAKLCEKQREIYFFAKILDKQHRKSLLGIEA